jgi:hypothetical protein
MKGLSVMGVPRPAPLSGKETSQELGLLRLRLCQTTAQTYVTTK